jgi:hypothetical protein
MENLIFEVTERKTRRCRGQKFISRRDYRKENARRCRQNKYDTDNLQIANLSTNKSLENTDRNFGNTWNRMMMFLSKLVTGRTETARTAVQDGG